MFDKLLKHQIVQIIWPFYQISMVIMKKISHIEKRNQSLGG